MESSEPSYDRLYPIFLKLSGKACLVVGGGSIALQKAEAMINCGACITVISPDAVPELTALASSGQLALEQRPYSPGEAAEYYLVIAATDQPDINQRVYDDAKSGGRIVNVVDVPELCDFYVPSILKRGRLQIAVSTAGAAPRIARRLRKKIDAQLPEAYEDLLEWLNCVRCEVKDLIPNSSSERMKVNKMIADSPEIEAFLNGNREPLTELIKHALDPYRD